MSRINILISAVLVVAVLLVCAATSLMLIRVPVEDTNPSRVPTIMATASIYSERIESSLLTPTPE